MIPVHPRSQFYHFPRSTMSQRSRRSCLLPVREDTLMLKIIHCLPEILTLTGYTLLLFTKCGTLPRSYFVLSNGLFTVTLSFPLGCTPSSPWQIQSSRTTSNTLFSVKPSLFSSGRSSWDVFFYVVKTETVNGLSPPLTMSSSRAPMALNIFVSSCLVCSR